MLLLVVVLTRQNCQHTGCCCVTPSRSEGYGEFFFEGQCHAYEDGTSVRKGNAMMRCPASHAMLRHARFLGTDAFDMGMGMAWA
jgi:hypothetical protein